jgi:hypothetical protein
VGAEIVPVKRQRGQLYWNSKFIEANKEQTGEPNSERNDEMQ